MTPTEVFVANGWTIYFHRLFEERYHELLGRVRKLRKRLPPEQYVQHAEVKLLARLNRILREVIPTNPEARDFWLEDDLSKFRRTKGFGLPDRYRLFWAFSTRIRVVIILYLNDEQTLRKRGSASDPYVVFRKLIEQGQLGSGLDANWKMVQEDMLKQQKNAP